MSNMLQIIRNHLNYPRWRVRDYGPCFTVEPDMVIPTGRADMALEPQQFYRFEKHRGGEEYAKQTARIACDDLRAKDLAEELQRGFKAGPTYHELKQAERLQERSDDLYSQARMYRHAMAKSLNLVAMANLMQMAAEMSAEARRLMQIE